MAKKKTVKLKAEKRTLPGGMTVGEALDVVNPVQVMQEQVQSMAQGLGVEIKFDTDKSLGGYKKGRSLTMGEVKKAAEEKRPVWVYYKEYEEDRPRINAAQFVSVERESFIFSDGSSFASDLDITLDHHPAEDDKGEGEFKVDEAVKK